MHSAYGENIPFRGTTRFRSIPQPNTRMGSRCGTVPIHSTWFWNRTHPKCVAMENDSVWWPDGEEERSGEELLARVGFIRIDEVRDSLILRAPFIHRIGKS